MPKLSQVVAFGTVLACADAFAGAANPIARYPGIANTPQQTIRQSFVRHHGPPPFPPRPRVAITRQDRVRAQAAGWQPVPGFTDSDGAGTELLMTDGTVMVQNNDNNWYSLAPNKNGSYVNGTWTKKASLPAGYGPLYFASAVLADGKLVINGGEYNNFINVESNKGAIYDPIANTWTNVPPPSGASNLGDAQSAVLDNGTYMIGNCCSNVQYLFDESTLTFTQTGAGKADANSEEGWDLLPDGELLTCDVFDEPNSELYNPTTGSWSTAGNVPVDLVDSSFEIGPEILGQNGIDLATGATQFNAYYNTRTGTWSTAPNFPIVNGQQVDIADGPATVLTNGEVLLAASPGAYNSPTTFLIFNGRQFVPIQGPPNAPNDSSYNIRLLMLPNGQVLETDGTDDVEVYTPNVSPNQSIAPAISSVPSTLTHGSTYQIFGQRFNGFTQDNFYGDDDQQATNYPLVVIVNDATHHIFFARTHNHSYMGVASQMTVSTYFDVPSNIETGASKLVVIANGIHSPPVSVTVQ